MRIPVVLALLALAGCGKVTENGGGGGTDAGPGRVSCNTDDDCPLDQPVCDTGEGLCRGCEASAECSARIGYQQCDSGSGACVACVTNDQCLSESAPFCDRDELVCRGCELNDECASGVCDIDSASCAPSDNVIFVDNTESNAAPGCGSATSPCSDLAEAFLVAATIPIVSDDDRRYVVVVPTQSDYQAGSVAYAATSDTYVLAAGASFDQDFQVTTANEGVVWVGGTFVSTESSPAPISCTPGGGLRVVAVDITGYSLAIDSLDCDLEVYDSSFTGNGRGVSADGSISTRIERNVFRDGGDRAIFFQGADGIIRNNLVVGNGQNSLPSAVSGNTSNDADKLLIAYNTITGNVVENEEGVGVVNCGGPGTTVLESNIIFGNVTGAPAPGYPIAESCTSETIVNNILQVPMEDALLSTNSNTPPLFVNPGEGDYRLGPTSPAIDAGDVAAAAPTDVLGNLRPVGSGPDVGAYERQ